MRDLEKKYGLTAPHSEVRAVLEDLRASPGTTVLDLGSGRGRNSFFLSEHGFELTAVERSEKAVATLREIQEAEGLPFRSYVYDINDARLEDVLDQEKVDHIISTVVFQLLDATRIAAIIENMQAVTRSNGLHLIVAPITSPDAPCPIDFPFVFESGELRTYYDSWEILRYEETAGEFHKLDENGERYQGRFSTLVARKP